MDNQHRDIDQPPSYMQGFSGAAISVLVIIAIWLLSASVFSLVRA